MTSKKNWYDRLRHLTRKLSVIYFSCYYSVSKVIFSYLAIEQPTQCDDRKSGEPSPFVLSLDIHLSDAPKYHIESAPGHTFTMACPNCIFIPRHARENQISEGGVIFHISPSTRTRTREVCTILRRTGSKLKIQCNKLCLHDGYPQLDPRSLRHHWFPS